jgi:peptidoglycan/LPS O-acetylase OafA/YrhL
MNAADSLYINRLRGASILRVVLGHLGLGWIFLPYSSYIGIFLSVLFFCSGYIFFYIFGKSKSIGDYLFRRVFGVVLPFYLIYIFALVVSMILGKDFSGFNLYKVFQILIVAPDIRDMPYPLGQIWYLRVLVFCTLISPIIFIAAKYNKYILLFPLLVAGVFAYIQTGYKFHKLFFYVGHNLLQEILYGAYFFIGAFVYNTSWRENKLIIFILMVVCIAISIAAIHFWGLDLNLSKYAYAPNLLYFPLGIVGILLVLLLVNQFEWCFLKVTYLAKMLDFCSKHSYGIYLNHSFFIVFYEYIFGLKGVMGSPLLALTKIILVVVSSMVCAVPITYLSQYCLKLLRGDRQVIKTHIEVK